MKIELIQEEGFFRRSLLYCDGECLRRIDHSIVSLQDCVSLLHDDLFFEKIKLLEYQGAFRFSLRALSKQALHSSQLESKLKRRFVQPEVIESVLKNCVEKGFLSDEEILSSLATKWERQGKSQLQRRQKAKQMGIPLGKESFDEKEALRQLIYKKFPQFLQDGLSKEARNKIVQSILRRGFSYSILSEVLLSITP